MTTQISTASRVVAESSIIPTQPQRVQDLRASPIDRLTFARAPEIIAHTKNALAATAPLIGRDIQRIISGYIDLHSLPDLLMWFPFSNANASSSSALFQSSLSPQPTSITLEEIAEIVKKGVRADFIALAELIEHFWKTEPENTKTLIGNFYRATKGDVRTQQKLWKALLLTKFPPLPTLNRVFEREVSSAIHLSNNLMIPHTAPGIDTMVWPEPHSEAKNESPMFGAVFAHEDTDNDIWGEKWLASTFKSLNQQYVPFFQGSMVIRGIDVFDSNWDTLRIMALYVAGIPVESRNADFYSFVIEAIPDECLTSLDLTFHFSGIHFPMPLKVFETIVRKSQLINFTCLHLRFEAPIAEYEKRLPKQWKRFDIGSDQNLKKHPLPIISDTERGSFENLPCWDAFVHNIPTLDFLNTEAFSLTRGHSGLQVTFQERYYEYITDLPPHTTQALRNFRKGLLQIVSDFNNMSLKSR